LEETTAVGRGFAVHTIDLENMPQFEAGAIILALTACPDLEQDQGRKLADLQASLCALFLRGIHAANPQDAYRPQLMKPAYAFRDERQIERDWKNFKRRIDDRMIAARMVIPFLQEAFTNRMPDLKGIQGRGLSLNRVATLVSGTERVTGPENIETRIWRPSRSVIHLAAAIELLGKELKRTRGYELTVFDIMLHRSIIEWIVLSAAEIESLIDKSERLRVKREDLIQLRLADQPSERREANASAEG
jgi:hypothetical protein